MFIQSWFYNSFHTLWPCLIACSAGDNNALSTEVNLVVGLTCGVIFDVAIGLGVLGKTGVCIFCWGNELTGFGIIGVTGFCIFLSYGNISFKSAPSNSEIISSSSDSGKK